MSVIPKIIIKEIIKSKEFQNPRGIISCSKILNDSTQDDGNAILCTKGGHSP